MNTFILRVCVCAFFVLSQYGCGIAKEEKKSNQNVGYIYSIYVEFTEKKKRRHDTSCGVNEKKNAQIL